MIHIQFRCQFLSRFEEKISRALVPGWCPVPQRVTAALGVTGTPSAAGCGRHGGCARFPGNFSDIGAAQRATARRSDVCTRVGTTGFVYSPGFGFLVPPRFLGSAVHVFQPHPQAAVNSCSMGAGKLQTFGSRSQGSAWGTKMLSLRGLCSPGHLLSKRCWAQNINCFSEKTILITEDWTSTHNIVLDYI